MTNIEPIFINSVANYIEEIGKLDFPRFKIFRGENQNFGNTRLVPKIGREMLKSENKNEIKYLEESHLFNWFKSESVKYLDNCPRSDIELLSLAQHHGLNTRLLDFTLNPLIALFFAVEDEKYDKEGYVYVADEIMEIFPDNTLLKLSFTDLKTSLKKEKRDYVFFLPPNSNVRINNQSGVMCFFEKPMEGYQNFKTVFEVSGSKKSDIKSMLYKLGITEEFIFQDLDNLCKSLNYRKYKYKL